LKKKGDLLKGYRKVFRGKGIAHNYAKNYLKKAKWVIKPLSEKKWSGKPFYAIYVYKRKK
jgi:hypothetical protein